MKIAQNVCMKNHTSFKIGGNADFFCEPTDVDDILEAINFAQECNVPYFIIGNGTNLLVSDSGIRGIVIKISSNFSDCKVNGNTIKAYSGTNLTAVSALALKNSLSGMEFASGIPGTVGGAVYMNAGAYGGEIKDIVKSVTYLENGKIKTLEQNSLEFGYRKSFFVGRDAVILSAEFQLENGNLDEIKAKTDDFRQRRMSKQPLNFPSAGSTFKRPEGFFAGKLIEDCGLKGYNIGGAAVSQKHSGFVVNTGNATASDVYSLIKYIQRTVFEKFSVKLETEVKFLGDF